MRVSISTPRTRVALRVRTYSKSSVSGFRWAWFFQGNPARACLISSRASMSVDERARRGRKRLFILFYWWFFVLTPFVRSFVRSFVRWTRMENIVLQKRMRSFRSCPSSRVVVVVVIETSAKSERMEMCRRVGGR